MRGEVISVFNGVIAKSTKDKTTLFNECFSLVFRPPAQYLSSSTCDQPRSLEFEKLSDDSQC